MDSTLLSSGHRWPRLIGTALVAGLWLVGTARHIAGAAEARPLHGALPMDEQLKRLGTLRPERDVTQPPPRIDPFIWSSVVPKDNAMTAARVALGKRLYFDTQLSADGTVACATCHDVSRGFTDQRAVAEGIRDQLGRRNAPTTMNALLFQTMFLDGRAPTLEAQAKMPIVNPIEMGQTASDAAVHAIADDLEYQRQF